MSVWKSAGDSMQKRFAAFAPETGRLMRRKAKDQLIREGRLDDNGEFVPRLERQIKSPLQGAATILWRATSQMLEGFGGEYCENCDIARVAEA